MRWFWMSVAAAGLAVSSVGLLWFLQGSDLVHLEPLACVGECQAMVGHHLGWQIAGTLAVLIGAIATTVAARRVRSVHP